MKRPGSILIVMMMVSGLFSFSAKAGSTAVVIDTIPVSDTIFIKISGDAQLSQCADNPDDTRKKRFVAALCAFPFPLGFMGAHRVMLGTEPWVPVVYVATFGGCFGLLPLIDFCVLTFSKDISKYENNPHIFMWVTDSKSPETGTE